MVVDILTPILLTLVIFIAVLILRKVSICGGRFLFGVNYYVNFNFYFEKWSVDTKWWAKCELECLLLISIYVISKFKVTCKNADFECRCISTYSEEKTSKFSYIKIRHFPLFSIKMFQTNCCSEYFGIYFPWWNHRIHLWVIETQGTQNVKFFNLNCVTFTQPIWVPLTVHYWQNWKRVFLSCHCMKFIG